MVHEEKRKIDRMLRSSKPDRWSLRYERREMEALSVNIETFISGGVRSQRESCMVVLRVVTRSKEDGDHH